MHHTPRNTCTIHSTKTSEVGDSPAAAASLCHPDASASTHVTQHAAILMENAEAVSASMRAMSASPHADAVTSHNKCTLPRELGRPVATGTTMWEGRPHASQAAAHCDTGATGLGWAPPVPLTSATALLTPGVPPDSSWAAATAAVRTRFRGGYPDRPPVVAAQGGAPPQRHTRPSQVVQPAPHGQRSSQHSPQCDGGCVVGRGCTHG